MHKYTCIVTLEHDCSYVFKNRELAFNFAQRYKELSGDDFSVQIHMRPAPLIQTTEEMEQLCREQKAEMAWAAEAARDMLSQR